MVSLPKRAGLGVRRKGWALTHLPDGAVLELLVGAVPELLVGAEAHRWRIKAAAEILANKERAIVIKNHRRVTLGFPNRTDTISATQCLLLYSPQMPYTCLFGVARVGKDNRRMLGRN